MQLSQNFYQTQDDWIMGHIANTQYVNQALTYVSQHNLSQRKLTQTMQAKLR